jgi:hypothetical protein
MHEKDLNKEIHLICDLNKKKKIDCILFLIGDEMVK